MAKIISKNYNGFVVNQDFQDLEEYKIVKSKYENKFENIIKYIYYVYNPDGIYADLYFEKRKEKVCNKYSLDVNYEEDNDIMSLINEYNLLAKSREERFRDDVLRDMEELIERLHKIQFEKEAKVTIDGKEHITMIDNSDEKIKLISSVEKLITLSKKYETIIIKDKIKESNKGRRMFDGVIKED